MGTPSFICGDCYYFRSDPELVGFGECRAHPPMIDMIPLYAPPREEEQPEETEDGMLMLRQYEPPEQVGVTRLGVWPQVPVDGWCGEHERIPDA